MNAEPLPELITTARAARLLGVTQRTVVRYVERGYIKGGPLTPGGPWKISGPSVDALIAKWRAKT